MGTAARIAPPVIAPTTELVFTPAGAQQPQQSLHCVCSVPQSGQQSFAGASEESS
jgi:hypothetical protein